MRSFLPSIRAVFGSLGLVASISAAFGGGFTNDFNSGAPSGATAYGSALVDSSGGVGDTGVLKLTPAATGQQGSYIIDDLDPGQRVSSFVATFSVRMGGGTATPGDGMSFNLAADLPNSDFSEDGAGTGLTITFDTYENANPQPYDNSEGPEVRIKVGGNLIARRKITNQFRTDVNFVPVSVSYSSAGALTLVYNNIVLYTNFFVTGAFQTGARFGFSGRCGGLDETHYVDDLTITTVPVSRFYVKGNVTPFPGIGISPSAEFGVSLQDSGAAVDTNTVRLNFNGANVTPSVSKNPGNNVTTISYQPPVAMPYSSINHLSVRFSYVGDSNPDVLNYDFLVSQAPLWSLSVSNRSYLLQDPNLGGGGSTPLWRGVAYNALSNHIIIAAHTNQTGGNVNPSGLTINVLDAKTGADLYQLQTNGIPGNNQGAGTFPPYFMGVADDGRVFGCNITTTNGVVIYCWDTDSSTTTPRVVFASTIPGAPGNARWGDTFAVRGAGAGTQIILDAQNSPTNVVLTAIDSAVSGFTAALFTNGYTGTVIGRGLQFGPTNTLFLKKRSTGTLPIAPQPLKLIRLESTPATTTLLSVSDFYPQVGVLTVDLTKNLAAGIMFVTNTAIPDRLIVYDISNLTSPLPVAQYNFPTNHQNNSNFIGEVAFGPDTIYAVDGNNGIIAVPAYPTFLPGLSITRSNTTVVLTWTHSIPEFVLQSSPSLLPPVWTNTGLSPTLTGNMNTVVDSVGTGPKFYRLAKP